MVNIKPVIAVRGLTRSQSHRWLSLATYDGHRKHRSLTTLGHLPVFLRAEQQINHCC